ncbi:MAG: Uma2 family endonuclease [Planctomycetota bacterium]
MSTTLKKPPRPKPVQPRLPLSDEEPRPLKWTREEYYRLGDEGFFRGQRVQLIEGSIIEMSPQKNAHSVSLLLTCDLMQVLFGSTRTVRYQLPLKLSDVSEPEPDVAIVTGKPRDWSDHPTTAELVIEISDSTLKFDLTNKVALYAQALIPEYWVVDLIHRQIIVHRQPKRPRSGPARYEEVTVYEADAVVKPLAKPKASVKVADLLP